MMAFVVGLLVVDRWARGGPPGLLPAQSAAAAALILVHPPVALVGLPFLAVAAFVLEVRPKTLSVPRTGSRSAFKLAPESRGSSTERLRASASSVSAALPARSRRALAAVAALLLGGGLSAFYAFPVLFEWDLVQAGRAFEGYYHYARHFVALADLLGPLERTRPIPLALGRGLLAVAALNLAGSIAFARGMGRERARLMTCAVALAAYAGWLMSETSAPVWERVGWLARLQFPWRLLALMTPAVALLAGMLPPALGTRSRALIAAAAVVALLVVSPRLTAYELDTERTIPAGVEDLAGRDFRPDIADEWLPVGATPGIATFLDSRRPFLPEPGPGVATEEFRRGQGWMSVCVRADEESHVLLPQYHFAAGWTATLAGRRLPLGPGPHGLMRVELPAGATGRLEVRFGMTPMRRAGWGVTALAVLAVTGLWLGGRRRCA